MSYCIVCNHMSPSDLFRAVGVEAGFARSDVGRALGVGRFQVVGQFPGQSFGNCGLLESQVVLLAYICTHVVEAALLRFPMVDEAVSYTHLTLPTKLEV